MKVVCISGSCMRLHTCPNIIRMHTKECQIGFFIFSFMCNHFFSQKRIFYLVVKLNIELWLLPSDTWYNFVHGKLGFINVMVSLLFLNTINCHVIWVRPWTIKEPILYGRHQNKCLCNAVHYLWNSGDEMNIQACYSQYGWFSKTLNTRVERVWSAVALSNTIFFFNFWKVLQRFLEGKHQGFFFPHIPNLYPRDNM